MILNNDMHAYGFILRITCFVFMIWDTYATIDICTIKSQLPGMPVATCSDPTRDLL